MILRRGLILLLLGVITTGCSGGPESGNDNGQPNKNDNVVSNENGNTSDLSNTNQNSNTPINENENGTSDPSAFCVSLGGDRDVFSSDSVSLQAKVENPPSEAELYYLWEFQQPCQRDAAAYETRVAQKDFVKNLDWMTIVPADLTGCTDSAYDLNVRVDVLAVTSQANRTASSKITLHVFEKPSPNVNANVNTNLNVNTNTNTNSNINSNANANDNANTNVNGNENENGNGNGNGNGNANGNANTNVNANDNSSPDPCEGITDLTVTLDSDFTMSLQQGSLYLNPVVCGGTPPYTYSWTPVTYLQEADEGLTEITTSTATFMPTTMGTFAVSINVQDQAGAPGVTGSTSIRVVNYAPLVTDGGEDHTVVRDSVLSLTGLALGGSGNYSYSWSPGGPAAATFNNVPTTQTGEFNYIFTVTDTETTQHVSDTVRVVVFDNGGACSESEYPLGITQAEFVAYDAGYGSAGQAVVVNGTQLHFLDLSSGTLRPTVLTLPSSVTGLELDSVRNRGFACTRSSDGTVCSVQVFDLDAPSLGNNISLTAGVQSARGMAVVPSTGDVLVAVTGTSSGLMKVNPVSGTVTGAVQNIHYTNSFLVPIDVAVVETGSLSVAVVANLVSNKITLVPLANITFAPDNPAGGGQTTLPQIALSGTGRAIVADSTHSRVVVGWNNGALGRAQSVNLTSNSAGTVDSSVSLSGTVASMGIDVNPTLGQGYAVLSTGDVNVIDLSYRAVVNTLHSGTVTGLGLAGDTDRNKILIVGVGTSLLERCP